MGRHDNSKTKRQDEHRALRKELVERLGTKIKSYDAVKELAMPTAQLAN